MQKVHATQTSNERFKLKTSLEVNKIADLTLTWQTIIDIKILRAIVGISASRAIRIQLTATGTVSQVSSHLTSYLLQHLRKRWIVQEMISLRTQLY